MAITLEELAHMISGKLDVGCIRADLLNSMGDVCTYIDPVGSNSFRFAIGIGSTEQEAREDLAEKLRGKSLIYSDKPTRNEFILIPPTLTGQADPEIGNEVEKLGYSSSKNLFG